MSNAQYGPGTNGVANTGTEKIQKEPKFNGDLSRDYLSEASATPNQVLDCTINCPMWFVLDNFNSTKPSTKIIEEGDQNTRVHEFIAVGMVRATELGCTEVITEVEWSETKIRHKCRTVALVGLPNFMIHGYAADNTIEDIGNGKTRLINRAFQHDRIFMLGSPCCCCLCWAPLCNKILSGDIPAMEKKWAKMLKDGTVKPGEKSAPGQQQM